MSDRTDGKVSRETPWVRDGLTERKVAWEPGYDCRTKCVHKEQSSHGQHGDSLGLWIRSLDGTYGLTLDLWTYVRDGQPMEMIAQYGYSAIFSTRLFDHKPFATDEDQIREGREPDECQILLGGKCYGSSGRNGDSLWRPADTAAILPHLCSSEVEHILLNLAVRGSSVWDRLADLLPEMQSAALATLETTKAQCPQCKGCGLVERARSTGTRKLKCRLSEVEPNELGESPVVWVRSTERYYIWIDVSVQPTDANFCIQLQDGRTGRFIYIGRSDSSPSGSAMYDVSAQVESL